MARREAAVDTNVFVHAVFVDSERHEEARRLLVDLDSWAVPENVLFEIVWVVRRLGLSVGAAADLVGAIVGDPKARVVGHDVEDVTRALATLAKEGLSLAHFNDKVIVLTARRLDLPLATFDAYLRRQAERAGLSVLP